MLGDRSSIDTGDVRFFTICDRRYFAGFVSLLNSLRLTGHQEPITVLDRGMTDAQVKAIASHCDVVSIDIQSSNPTQLVAYPHRLNFRGVAVLIDSDMIVLRRLDRAIDEARAGRICVFRDPDDKRFFSEWTEIFALQAPLRRQPYYSAGLVALSTVRWPDLLRMWWQALERIWHLPTFMEGASMGDDPVSQSDQDALNALLMSELPADAVYELPAGEMTLPRQFEDVSIDDLDQLKCTQRGRPVSVLHCALPPKPWQPELLKERRNTYAFLPVLRRTLIGSGLRIELPNALLAPWLRRGPIGSAAFQLVNVWLHPGPPVSWLLWARRWMLRLVRKP